MERGRVTTCAEIPRTVRARCSVRCIRAEASYTGSEDLTRRRRSCPVPLQDPLENQYSLRKGGLSTFDLRDVRWRCLHPFGRKGVVGGPLHGGFGAWVGLWKRATLRTIATRCGIRHRLQIRTTLVSHQRRMTEKVARWFDRHDEEETTKTSRSSRVRVRGTPES